MELNYICNKDSILKEYLVEIGLSKKFLRKIKLEGSFYINDKKAKNYYKVFKEDRIKIVYFEKENNDIIPYEEKLKIVYSDEFFIIVFKEKDLCIQPTKKHYYKNLVSIIKAYYQENKIEGNVHIINRLDYQTSGLIIATNLSYVHNYFNSLKIEKKYLCLIEGIMDLNEGVLNYPIKRKDNTILREVNDLGKTSLTKYKVLKEFDNKSLVLVDLLTGRTHQIRVHFSYINHALVGDKLYGKENKRLYLSCFHLKFEHPISKKNIEIEEIDKDFFEFFNNLKSNN